MPDCLITILMFAAPLFSMSIYCCRILLYLRALVEFVLFYSLPCFVTFIGIVRLLTTTTPYWQKVFFSSSLHDLENRGSCQTRYLQLMELSSLHCYMFEPTNQLLEKPRQMFWDIFHGHDNMTPHTYMTPVGCSCSWFKLNDFLMVVSVRRQAVRQSKPTSSRRGLWKHSQVTSRSGRPAPPLSQLWGGL